MMKNLKIGAFIMATLAIPFIANAQNLTNEDIKSRAAHKPIAAQKIILVGDSTTQVLSGWGGEFCAHHLTSNVSCINLGRGGRSSFSYRAEKSWDIALSEMQTKGYKKIYVLIQFGHNDMPGKPGRSTDVKTEFPKFLTQYVIEAKKAGAIPILVTPLTRRSFKDGVLENDLMPWADAARLVAKEQNVALIDLNALSAQMVQKMGALESLKLAQLPPPQEVIDAAKGGNTIEVPKPNNQTPLPCTTAPTTTNCQANVKPTGVPSGKVNMYFDYTHIGDDGAKVFAKIITEELAKIEPDLSGSLIP
jgi:lysophospholipase L1-like esterase